MKIYEDYAFGKMIIFLELISLMRDMVASTRVIIPFSSQCS